MRSFGYLFDPMKKQIAFLFVALFSFNTFAQTSDGSLTTSANTGSSILSLKSYDFDGAATVGGFAPPNSSASGRYYSIAEKVTHKASQIALNVGLNFNQVSVNRGFETDDYFDNPTVNLMKSWRDVGYFTKVQASLSTTLPGNRYSTAATYMGSVAPALRLTKETGRVTWVQTYAYGHGAFRNQSVEDQDGVVKTNSPDVWKMAQVLGYQMSESFVATAYGHAHYAIPAGGVGRGRVAWCLGGEYTLSKFATVGFGYGPGSNFVSLDPMADQLNYGSYQDAGYAEINLTF